MDYNPYIWICMAKMQKEQVPKNMIPNGGLMVIYHGTSRKTSPIK